MEVGKAEKRRFDWLGPAMGLLAVGACYGTLATVALLSVIGISVEIDETLMVKVISGMLILVLAGMSYSWKLHRQAGPLALSVAASGLLLWVFFGSYSKALELTGFLMLGAASIWDFRAKKQACPLHCGIQDCD